MPVSLLTLPCELREHILTALLLQSGSIRLQHDTGCKTVFTPAISQVCRVLREEAVRVYYRVNTFTLTIDPEEVSLDIELFSRAQCTMYADIECIRHNPTISSLPFLPILMQATMEKPTLVSRSPRDHRIPQVSRKTSAT